MKNIMKYGLLFLALLSFNASAMAATLSDPRYNNVDTDADGLPDKWETYQVGDLTTMDGGLSTANPTDTDGDGYSDLVEFTRDWDPKTPDLLRYEAQRRIPPMIETLTIPETMVAGSTVRLSWKVMGYEGSYTTHIAMFDCRTAAPTTCGDNYSDATRFYGVTVPHILVENTTWNYVVGTTTETASYFTFNHDFVVPNVGAGGVAWTANSPIVIRFYQKSNKARDVGKPSISLLIPGGLSNTYYDKVGRRIGKLINP